VLNAYFTPGHNSGGFCAWWRRLTGSDASLDRFSRRVRAYQPVVKVPRAFGRRCIPAGYAAPPSNMLNILSRRALPARRLPALGAAPGLPHGLLCGREKRVRNSGLSSHNGPKTACPTSQNGHSLSIFTELLDGLDDHYFDWSIRIVELEAKLLFERSGERWNARIADFAGKIKRKRLTLSEQQMVTP
jgi:hypothetical protein